MLSFGDVILSKIQFVDTYEVKRRPALVLFEEMGNVVVAGITSNEKMKGVKISKKEGAVSDCVVKLNYIFTVSEKMVEKKLFSLDEDKKSLIKREFNKKLM